MKQRTSKIESFGNLATRQELKILYMKYKPKYPFFVRDSLRIQGVS